MSKNSRTLAIIGAGPTGLEAALAAAEAGFDFTLYEASDEVAGYVRDWGHVRLFSPWSLDISPRMRRHLEEAGHELPEEESSECPTGLELYERILAPVAALPALEGRVETGVRIAAIGRDRFVKSDEIGTGKRAEQPFRLLLRRAGGREWVETADIVLDCSGTYGNPNALGAGGIPAPGEREVEGRIVRRIPDFEREASAWAGRTILLVGAGHSAQTAAVGLAKLAEDAAGTRISWSLRSPDPDWHVDPDDPLPERRDLTERARELAGGASEAIEAIPGTVIDGLELENGRVTAHLKSADGTVRSLAVDRVLAMTGAVGDHSIYRELQVHECYATSGPMGLAAALLGAGGGDCLAQVSHGIDSLKNPEPNFFILGSKSYGRNNTFLMRAGWDQVADVFAELEGSAAAKEAELDVDVAEDSEAVASEVAEGA